MPQPHEIFISYSAPDAQTAGTVCAALERQSIRCWIAPRDILPGVEYAEALIDGISKCQVFLLILSAASNTSPQVTREVERAVSKGITILPFRISDVILSKSMEYYLSQCHWLDASSPPVDKHIAELVETARRLLTPRASEPAVRGARESDAPERPDSADPARRAMREGPLSPVGGNPFTFGNPILAPTRFYGRKQELRQIVNRLLSGAHESTSVVGERRIGKTSLLCYLANPEVAARLGLTPAQYCMVYIDFQGLTDISPQRFWQRVLSKVARESSDPELAARFKEMAGRNEFDLFDLEDLFEVVTRRGLHVVLLLDEFEYVTLNAKFDANFFGALRSLAIHYPLTLIPSTRRELVALCHSDELKGSPFFNIFANVVLRPFSRVEADALVEGYASNAGLALTPEDRELIVRLGGGHPFLIQMAGYYLAEEKLQGKGSEGHKSATANFVQQAEPHYSYLWSHSSESEKITLLTIMTASHAKESKETVPNLENLTRTYPRAQQDVTALIQRGLLEEEVGVYALFSPTFESWISREIAAPAGAEENAASVETWLAEGGREHLKPLKGTLPRFKKKYWPVVGRLLQEASFKAAVQILFGIGKLYLGV